MAGIGSLVRIDRPGLTSPSTLLRLSERLMQLGEHISDPHERYELVSAAERLAGRKQLERPSYD